MAKHCIRCGKEINDNASFCRFCGQDQTVPAGQEKPHIRDRRAEEEEYLRKRKQTDDTTKSRVIDYVDDDEYEIIDDDKVVISKKTLMIAGAIALIALLAFGVWFFFIRDTTTPPEPANPPVTDTDPDDGDTVSNPDDLDDNSTGDTGDTGNDTGSSGTTPDDETTTYTSTDPDDYPEDFLIPGSDSHYITSSEYSWMDQDQVQRAINEIYARRGRIFKDPEYSAFLNKCNWYVPMYSADEFDEAWFNDYEKKNLKVLSDHRKKVKKKN